MRSARELCHYCAIQSAEKVTAPACPPPRASACVSKRVITFYRELRWLRAGELLDVYPNAGGMSSCCQLEQAPSLPRHYLLNNRDLKVALIFFFYYRALLRKGYGIIHRWLFEIILKISPLQLINPVGEFFNHAFSLLFYKFSNMFDWDF